MPRAVPQHGLVQRRLKGCNVLCLEDMGLRRRGRDAPDNHGLSMAGNDLFLAAFRWRVDVYPVDLGLLWFGFCACTRWWCRRVTQQLRGFFEG